MPKIEINNFTAYEITPDSLISKLTAKNGKQFEVAPTNATEKKSAKKEQFEENKRYYLDAQGKFF